MVNCDTNMVPTLPTAQPLPDHNCSHRTHSTCTEQGFSPLELSSSTNTPGPPLSSPSRSQTWKVKAFFVGALAILLGVVVVVLLAGLSGEAVASPRAGASPSVGISKPSPSPPFSDAGDAASSCGFACALCQCIRCVCG